MNSTLKSFLIIIVSLIFGSIVNMGIVMISGSIIELPAGADVTTVEGLKESLHLFEPKHFIFPFLAHALGTLAGAMFTYKFSGNNGKNNAMLIGVIFLIFGTINVFMLPAPMWFNVVDLVGAYIPMAYIGIRLSKKK